MLVKLERSFDSNLMLECGGQQFNAKSIINLLSLEPDPSSEMTATAEGPDADRMILAIQEFFAREFRSPSESLTSSRFHGDFTGHFHLTP